jgi:hypothetical protein
MQPNSQIPNKIASNSPQSPNINDLHDTHYKKQQQFFADKKEKDKKAKKSKKDKSKKSSMHEDRIRMNQEPAPRNLQPKHEYQNVSEEHAKLLQMENERKFGDTAKLYEKKTRCAIQDGVYVFHNGSSVGSSLTSFAEIENHKKVSQEIDINGSGKLKNFNLSKYLNIDVKSVSPEKGSSDKQEASSSKSSSLSNQSIDSMERNIILNGLKNNEDQSNSYLGPFNFRKLLKPTGIAPTESLRKRKKEMVTSSPPPDKNLRTNGLF